MATKEDWNNYRKRLDDLLQKENLLVKLDSQSLDEI